MAFCSFRTSPPGGWAAATRRRLRTPRHAPRGARALLRGTRTRRQCGLAARSSPRIGCSWAHTNDRCTGTFRGTSCSPRPSVAVRERPCSRTSVPRHRRPCCDLLHERHRAAAARQPTHVCRPVALLTKTLETLVTGPLEGRPCEWQKDYCQGREHRCLRLGTQPRATTRRLHTAAVPRRIMAALDPIAEAATAGRGT